MPNPVFTIITVVYNGEQLLASTIQSVKNQTYPHIEYLIIDGASKDKSMEIVRKYAAEMPFLKFISEKDKGLYDAMNKGLRMATGDFVWFLNAGDHLHAPDTIEKIAQLVTPKTGVLYGETFLVNDNREPAGRMSELSTRKIPEKLRWKNYLGGMLVVHQSFVPRRIIAPEYISDNLCADYDWCIKILKNSPENINTNLILTDYLMGGMEQKTPSTILKRPFFGDEKSFWLVSGCFGAWVYFVSGWVAFFK